MAVDVARLNRHFEGFTRILAVPWQQPELVSEGSYAPDEAVRQLAEAALRRGEYAYNDAHALVSGADWDTHPPIVRYRTTDFAVIQALRKTGEKPAVLSACALVISADQSSLYLHRRSRESSMYPDCLHSFGGAFMPGGAGQLDQSDRSLVGTMLREVAEESGKRPLEGGWPMIMVDEPETGFVHCAFLGVQTPSTEPFASPEGESVRLPLADLEGALLRARDVCGTRGWCPSGKLHAMAWLALGAPGAPGWFQDDAQRLFERVLAGSARDYLSAK